MISSAKEENVGEYKGRWVKWKVWKYHSWEN